MAERAISADEAEALQDDPSVIGVAHDELPTDIADEFVEVLARIGVDVEVLVPPAGYPSVFYRIGHSSSDVARLPMLIAKMTSACREVAGRLAAMSRVDAGYRVANAEEAARMLREVITRAETEAGP